MSTDVLAGTRLKLQRAYHHLQQLQIVTDQWLDSGHYRYWCERDAKDLLYVILKASADEIPADPFSLLLGDILHNLRSGLDHLIYALSAAAVYPDPLPDDVAKDSQFPIVGDEDRNGTSGRGPELFQRASSRIRGLNESSQAAIERLQPFQDGGNFRLHPLWQLNILSNIDKHRFLHVVCASSGGFTIAVPAAMTIGPGEIWSIGGVVKDETTIAKIPVTAHERDVNMHFKPVIHLSLTEEGIHFLDTHGTIDSDIIHVIGRIYNHILTVVLPAIEHD